MNYGSTPSGILLFLKNPDGTNYLSLKQATLWQKLSNRQISDKTINIRKKLTDSLICMEIRIKNILKMYIS